MGDIIHGLPAAALLKERLPNLQLTWLAEPAGIPLLEGNPAVDDTIVFPKQKWLKQLRSVSGIPATAAEASRFIAELKSRQFDATLDLQGLFKSSVLGFLSGANKRFGFQGTREGAERMLTHPLNVGDYFGFETHVVDHNVRLADFASRVLLGESSAEILSPSYIYKNAKFPLPAPPVGTVKAMRHLISAPSGSMPSPMIAFIPGTTWRSKIWESHKWTELARLCLSRLPGPLLLLGGPAEVDMNNRIAAGFGDRIVNLTGKTEIKDLIALFQMTDIVIGADTGPLHLAAAVGKSKVLGIFGSTPIKRNGPYGANCATLSLNLECQPCFQKECPLGTLACLQELSPNVAFEQVMRLVNQKPGFL